MWMSVLLGTCACLETVKTCLECSAASVRMAMNWTKLETTAQVWSHPGWGVSHVPLTPTLAALLK